MIKLSSAAGLSVSEENLDGSSQLNQLGSFREAPPSIYAESELKEIISKTDRPLSGSQVEMVTDIFDRLDPKLSLETRTALIEKLLTTKAAQLFDTHKGMTTLEHLHALADADRLAPVLERSGVSASLVLTSLIQDLVDRSRIDQGSKSSCATTVAQWDFCERRAALYSAQVAEGCITGRVTNTSGEEILSLNSYEEGDSRTATCRIYQTMLMEAAFMPELGEHEGLYSVESENLLETITETAFKRYNRGDSKVNSAIKDALSSDKMVVAAVEGLGEGAHALHKVNVLSIKGDYVLFRNPWGLYYQSPGAIGAEVVDKQQAIYRLPLHKFLNGCKYLECETGRKEDFGVTAGANDLEDTHGAVFFTVNMPIVIHTKTAESSERKVNYVAAGFHFEGGSFDLHSSKLEVMDAAEKLQYEAEWRRQNEEATKNIGRKETET